jgi:riboflavin kinase
MPRKPRLALGAVNLLKMLALKGAASHPIAISSREVGDALGVSQQTADNYMVDLAKRGLVKRALGGRKQHLTLTPDGVDALKSDYLELKEIFETGRPILFKGHVVSGVGEGRYYLSKKGYVDQFRSKLGYSPFPGTLNIRPDPEHLTVIDRVRALPGVRVDGFRAESRTFGGATCYEARLNDTICHLILPDRTHYQDILEFISPKNMRKVLGLEDGDTVSLEILR